MYKRVLNNFVNNLKVQQVDDVLVLKLFDKDGLFVLLLWFNGTFAFMFVYKN